MRRQYLPWPRICEDYRKPIYIYSTFMVTMVGREAQKKSSSNASVFLRNNFYVPSSSCLIFRLQNLNGG